MSHIAVRKVDLISLLCELPVCLVVSELGPGAWKQSVLSAHHTSSQAPLTNAPPPSCVSCSTKSGLVRASWLRRTTHPCPPLQTGPNLLYEKMSWWRMEHFWQSVRLVVSRVLAPCLFFNITSYVFSRIDRDW